MREMFLLTTSQSILFSFGKAHVSDMSEDKKSIYLMPFIICCNCVEVFFSAGRWICGNGCTTTRILLRWCCCCRLFRNGFIVGLGSKHHTFPFQQILSSCVNERDSEAIRKKIENKCWQTLNYINIDFDGVRSSWRINAKHTAHTLLHVCGYNRLCFHSAILLFVIIITNGIPIDSVRMALV